MNEIEIKDIPNSVFIIVNQSGSVECYIRTNRTIHIIYYDKNQTVCKSWLSCGHRSVFSVPCNCPGCLQR